MRSQMRLSHANQEILCCPICHARLKRKGEQYECADSGCAVCYPVVNGIPVLINEKSSLFSISDFVLHRNTFFNTSNENKVKNNLRRLIPDISANIKGNKNYRRFSEVLLGQSATPRVLVIGGSIHGKGMESILNNSAIDLVESDVAFGPYTKIICDAHDIPFENESFDGVIIQAVLEHVVDPNRCCDEIHRVLKKHGVVYAETPFMQQVHGGRYDFMRFTYLGHRRLFRWFEEIDSGAMCGPGMALAWSCQYFLLSFTSSKMLRALIKVFSAFATFYFKYIDYYLIDKPGALDAASGCYFMGKKSDHILSDHDLIKLYRGADCISVR